MAFLAYGLYVTWPQRVRALAPGLSRRAVMEKMSALPRVDVGLPTTDGRLLLLPRSTQPEQDQPRLLQRLRLLLPPPPPPRISQIASALAPGGASV